MERIAVVGAGLIGSAWAMVFARAGHPVRIWDPAAGASEAAMGVVRARLADLHAAGLITETAGCRRRAGGGGGDAGGLPRRRRPRAGERARSASR